MRKVSVEDIPDLAPGTVLHVMDDTMLEKGDMYVIKSNDNLRGATRFVLADQYDKRGHIKYEDVVLYGSINYCGVKDDDDFIHSLYEKGVCS